MTCPPLMFMVIGNIGSSEDINNPNRLNIRKDNLKGNVAKGVDFYTKLSERLDKQCQDFRSGILYDNINSDDANKVTNYFDSIVQNLTGIDGSCKCKSSLFGIGGDGFFDSKVADFNKMGLFNPHYCHRYLDARHLLTILFGNTKDYLYRFDIRKALKPMMRRIDQENDEEHIIQMILRLKLIHYERTKLISDCQTEAIIKVKQIDFLTI